MKKVTPDELKGGEVLAIPVYDKGQGVKLLEAGFPLDTSRVEKLKELEVNFIYVLEEDYKITSNLTPGADNVEIFPDYPSLELLKLPDCPAKTIYLEVYSSLKHIFNDYMLDKG
ncbi:MAG: hypothetical protein H5T99_11270, partial [Moorella sp. (in: Bacteria)]|nr:hypothetical protein [Moorella sp. (in: firmicutes)]